MGRIKHFLDGLYGRRPTMLGLNEEQVRLIAEATAKASEARLQAATQRAVEDAMQRIAAETEDRVRAAVTAAMAEYNEQIELRARQLMTRRVHSVRIMNSSGAFVSYSLIQGERSAFHAELRDRDGGAVRGPTAPVPEWSTSSPEIAIVGERTGLVEAVRDGTVDLICKVEGITQKVTLIVSPTLGR